MLAVTAASVHSVGRPNRGYSYFSAEHPLPSERRRVAGARLPPPSPPGAAKRHVRSAVIPSPIAAVLAGWRAVISPRVKRVAAVVYARSFPFRGKGGPGIGATSSLPDVLANVPSQSALPTFVICVAGPRFVEFTNYAPASRLRASWMQPRVTKVAREGCREVIEILGERPVALEPGEGSLDHSAARQDGPIAVLDPATHFWVGLQFQSRGSNILLY